MESKTVKIVIIIAVILGVLAIAGITALVVFTTKSSEPKIIDLNEENQIVENNDEEQANENEEQESNEAEVNQENEENNNEETSNLIESTTNSENSALKAFYDKLETYKGDNVSGEKVNELIDIIRRNNEQNQEYQIRAMADVQNWDSENNKAKTDSNYKVDFEKDEQTGYINGVKIEDAN